MLPQYGFDLCLSPYSQTRLSFLTSYSQHDVNKRTPELIENVCALGSWAGSGLPLEGRD